MQDCDDVHAMPYGFFRMKSHRKSLRALGKWLALLEVDLNCLLLAAKVSPSLFKHAVCMPVDRYRIARW